MGFPDTQVILIILGVLAIVLLYATHPRPLGKEILIAFLLSLVWVAYYPYSYVGYDDILIYNAIHVMPLVLHTAGLVFLRVLYERLPEMRYLERFIVLVLSTWILLWIVEAFGIYVLGISVPLEYPDLLGLGVLHIPTYAQVYYVLIGPAYILLTDTVDHWTHKRLEP
jgi:hypothetical protein